MEPLSVTASIIAVIQISGAVISICYEYRSAVKGALKAATRITKEVKGLQDVLERLLRLAEVEIAEDLRVCPHCSRYLGLVGLYFVARKT